MKKYIQPEIIISELQASAALMAGSGVANGDSVGNEYNSNDVTYSRDGSDWDDEE